MSEDLYILNPKTGRKVLKSGKIGRDLLKSFESLKISDISQPVEEEKIPEPVSVPSSSTENTVYNILQRNVINGNFTTKEINGELVYFPTSSPFSYS